MHLPNTKLLLGSCCDQLLARNGSTAVANQRLLACSGRTSFSLSKLSPKRQQSSQLVTFGSDCSRFSKVGVFAAFRRADTLGRYSSAVQANGKLSQLQNGEQLNPRLPTGPGDCKQYRRCLNANSADDCSKRYYSEHLNLKRQHLINSTEEKEYDPQTDKQIVEPVSANRYRAIENVSRIERIPPADELDKRKVSDQRYAIGRYKQSNDSSYKLNTSSKSGATLSHRTHQAAGSSVDKPSADQVGSSSSSSSQQQQATGRQEFTDLINVRSIYRNNLLNQSDQCDLRKMSGVPFKPKKALILTKFSRLEYERRRLADYTEDEVKESLIRRGSDYESLLNHHNIHTKSKQHVAKTLSEFGIEYRIVNRFEYSQEQIDWADVIITTGGDGTFLMAASKIFSKDKLVIGINSDPSRSVGYLCLPPSYSVNFRAALEKLASGDFRWVYRQRIRVSIKGENALDAPAELHDQQLLHPEFRYLDLETHPLNRRSNSPHRPDNFEYDYQVLPVRALNDVFVGECLSSRVSYFELQIEDKLFVKVKSSGVTICTGTGSTSWSFNINKISPQSVSTLFKIINEETNASLDASNEQLTKSITKKFNDSLIFDVCKNSMAYTVRDPVYMGNGFDSDNRGFAENIVVKSRMFDACVVIDGGLSYKFNDGSFAKFELLDEDQLKTVAF